MARASVRAVLLPFDCRSNALTGKALREISSYTRRKSGTNSLCGCINELDRGQLRREAERQRPILYKNFASQIQRSEEFGEQVLCEFEKLVARESPGLLSGVRSPGPTQ